MIRQAVLRRLGIWLAQLFFIAKVYGVVQLLAEHTAHVTESQLVLANATVAGNASHGHHHDGDADGAIQHHELQDLNGAPACLIAGYEPLSRMSPPRPVCRTGSCRGIIDGRGIGGRVLMAMGNGK
jgi:hypothetical protein